MNSLIAPSYGEPSIYELAAEILPTVQRPTQLLIRIHAASINGHDVIMASGKTKMLQNVPIPYRLGLDFAGTILGVGSEVKNYAIGDRVYGFHEGGATVATHLIADIESVVLAKIPAGLSYIQAASLPAVALTAERAFQTANDFFADGITGKTVFVSAALSGVGSVAIQIAKRKWRCNVITTASTAKIDKIDQYIGSGMVDQVVDYTKNDLVKSIGKQSVDFVLDTVGKAGDYLPLLRKGGLCISIARLPPGSAMKSDDPNAKQSAAAYVGQGVMNGIDAAFRLKASMLYGVTYAYQKTVPTQKDMDTLNSMVLAGQVKAVVGSTAKLQDLETIKAACTRTLLGKGALGKFVVQTSDDD